MTITRVNVVGTTGSGKSTFSKRLAKRLGVKYVESDALFWLPNWTEPTDEVFFRNLESALADGSWVLDGNFDRTRPVKWARVQMVVWLDYSFARVLYQSLKRAIVRAIKRDELWPGTGNRESIRKTFFSRDSILLWLFKSYPTIKRRYSSDMHSGDYPHIRFVRLRSPREAEAFLKQTP